MSSEKLERWHIESLFALAKEASPYECCGFITESGVVIPIKNIESSLFLFRMDPKQQLEAMKYSPIWAVYHSHVNSVSKPSPTDKAMQRTDYDQIIVSLMSNDISLFDSEWHPLKGWWFS